jgi:very-short-patch-repair endonuclease
MKLLDVNGNLVNVNITESKYPLRPKSKSILQQKVKEALISKYPREIILEEFLLPGSRLSIDLIIFKLKKAYEIDGIQHSQYTPLFHGQPTLNNFGKQISRDITKQAWCEANGIELIRITKEEDLEQLDAT